HVVRPCSRATSLKSPAHADRSASTSHTPVGTQPYTRAPRGRTRSVHLEAENSGQGSRTADRAGGAGFVGSIGTGVPALMASVAAPGEEGRWARAMER